jgi:hypothetical protein
MHPPGLAAIKKACYGAMRSYQAFFLFMPRRIIPALTPNSEK